MAFLQRPNLHRLKVKKDISSLIKEGLLTFAIANSVFLVCSFFFGVISGDSIQEIIVPFTGGLELTFLYQPDFAIFYLFALHFSGFSFGSQTLIALGSLAIGWAVAGIFVRLYYPEKGYTLILAGSLTMSIILSILVFGITLLPLFISLFVISFAIGAQGVFLLLLLLLLLFFSIAVIFAYTAFLCFTSLPGYVIIALTQKSKGFSETVLTTSASFLSPDWARLDLNVLPQNQPIQNSNKCPFKDENLNGCSFLGYQLPEKRVICDSPNTFRRCKSYNYLYARRLEIISEFAN